LARATSPDGDQTSDPGLSPTLTAAMTQAGTILGTAAYMAPEQARGKTVDHRADIWAMGTILFELLTAQRLFVGETVTDVLASVIKIEPDLNELPKDTSRPVRRMLERCLQRDPRRRLDSAADAILELDDDEVEATATTVSSRRSFLPWIPAVLLALALAVIWFRSAPEPEPGFRHQYDLALPEFIESESAYIPVVSPDGRWVAISLQDSLRTVRLLLHSLETGEQIFLENSVAATFPFWSPDSRFLGFFQPGGLRKLHLESGAVQIVTTEAKYGARGGSWSTDGKIIFAPGSNDGLLLVDAEGGPTDVITTVDSTMADGSHRWPQFLPDGQHYVFTMWSNILAGRADKGGIYLGSLDGSPPQRILRDVSGAVVSLAGQLFFHRSGQLMAVDFDLATGSVTSDPQLVAEAVGFLDSNGLVGVSADAQGSVFYCQYGPKADLALSWLGRDGRKIEGFEQSLPLTAGLELSPDGRHYVTEILDDEGSVQVWVGDPRRQSFTRLSRFDNDCWGATFSPDGREVLYGVQTTSGGALYRHDISGANAAQLAREFTTYNEFSTAGHWFAPDQVLVTTADSLTNSAGIHLLNLQDNSLESVLVAEFDQRDARLSPDGRWLAYVSTESGIAEVYVRNWPDLDSKWEISRRGGNLPHWNAAGTEIVFQAIRHMEIRAVDFKVEDGEPQISLPHRVTRLARTVRFTSYSADHQKYLVGMSKSDLELPPVRVLINWNAGNE
ncbi:MAG: protein kinase, partial [Candidatus Krumholzibacteria bacterium]|nr:protein kinase [Candidatus Krumholzibacteria bacterium]